MEVVPKLYNLLGKGGHLRRTNVFSKKNPPDNSIRMQGKMFADKLVKCLKNRFPKFGSTVDMFVFMQTHQLYCHRTTASLI